MDTRLEQLTEWLKTGAGLATFAIEPMLGDASFRRYFRIKMGTETFVAMDAPPPLENCKPYVLIADALRELGLNAPHIIASDLDRGFLLITDFGNKLLLRELHLESANKLYDSALDALAILQTCRKVNGMDISVFSVDVMRAELELCKVWYLQKHTQFNLSLKLENQLTNCFDFLCHTASEQPQVFIHRDYHSANLMAIPQNQIGILDFQDALMGPVTYDLVSLVRDCYISWPEAKVSQWVLDYHAKLNMRDVSQEEFLRWFDLMGLQRHLKALFIFARKLHRDNNANYLQHIPRVLAYVDQVSRRYPECQVLQEIFCKADLHASASTR